VLKAGSLSLVSVTRYDAGVYSCEADNQVPPVASKRLRLYVTCTYARHRFAAASSLRNVDVAESCNFLKQSCNFSPAKIMGVSIFILPINFPQNKGLGTNFTFLDKKKFQIRRFPEIFRQPKIY